MPDPAPALPSQSMCFWHPARPAVQACERCGTFGCTACLTYVGDAARVRLCPPCLARRSADLPSLDGRARLSKWALAAVCGFDLLSTLDDAVGGDYGLGAMVALGYLAAFITSVVLFCRWFHLAVQHVRARGVALSVTPGAAVGSWFIPFRNLVKPFAITREMLAAVGASQRPVGLWQVTWVLGNIASNASARTQAPALSIASSVLTLVSAYACAGVVKALTAALATQVVAESDA